MEKTRYIVASILAILLIFSLRFGDELLVLRWFKYLIPYGVMIGGLFILQRRKRDQVSDCEGLGMCLLLGIATLIYLFSSAATHFYFFFARHEIPGLKLTEYRDLLERLGIAAAILTPAFLFRRWNWWTPAMAVVLVGCVVMTGRAFFDATGGAPIYRDDHPAFMLRFTIFAETFPQILYYNPWWNGGKVTSYLVTSGSIGPGVFFWPFWEWGDMQKVYSPVLFAYTCVITPLIALLSVRLMGGSWSAAVITSMLCLCTSRYYVLWILHYGTVGFTFSMPWLLLASAAIYRVLWLDALDWYTAVILIASSFFFLAWGAAAPMGLPLAFAVLMSAKQLNLRKTYFLAACGFVIALLLLPCLHAIFNHSRVADLAASESARLSFEALFVDGGANLVERLRNGHPLILFFGILGVFFLRAPGIRLFYGTMVAIFLLEVSVFGQIKPQMELKRAAVPMFLIAAVPAGFWLDRLFTMRVTQAYGLQSFVAVLLVFGAWNLRDFYTGECLERFKPRQGYMDEFAAWIEKNVPDQARLAFAGPTRHAYSGAHVPMLPVETGREMMAVDYYSFSEKLVPYDFPPAPWGRTTRGTIDYYRMYGVSHIVCYDERLLSFYRRTPDAFQEVFEFGSERNFVVFSLANSDANRFQVGAGQVDSYINRLDVELEPGEKHVLRYHWDDDLEVSGKAELFREQVAEDIYFIGIRSNGEKKVTISYRKMW